MPRVTFSVQGGNQAVNARFTRAAAAVRESVVRTTNDHGLAHYEELYQATPVVSGLTRELLELESTPGGTGYRTGWRAASYEARGKVFYLPFRLYGTRFYAGDDYVDPINRRRAVMYRADIARNARAAARAR